MGRAVPAELSHTRCTRQRRSVRCAASHSTLAPLSPLLTFAPVTRPWDAAVCTSFSGLLAQLPAGCREGGGRAGGGGGRRWLCAADCARNMWWSQSFTGQLGKNTELAVPTELTSHVESMHRANAALHLALDVASVVHGQTHLLWKAGRLGAARVEPQRSAGLERQTGGRGRRRWALAALDAGRQSSPRREQGCQADRAQAPAQARLKPLNPSCH